MTAGLNIKVDVIRTNYASDDVVGGAVVTGTTVYSHLPFAMTPRRPSQVSLEAGLETETFYDGTCSQTFYRSLVAIQERDEIQVVHPPEHPLYNLRFRVLGVGPGRRRQRYGAIHTTLSRIRESRSNSFP